MRKNFILLCVLAFLMGLCNGCGEKTNRLEVTSRGKEYQCIYSERENEFTLVDKESGALLVKTDSDLPKINEELMEDHLFVTLTGVGYDLSNGKLVAFLTDEKQNVFIEEALKTCGYEVELQSKTLSLYLKTLGCYAILTSVQGEA